MSVLDQTKMYWRFAWGLRGFLKEPITLEQCRETIRQRLQNRETNLVLLVKRAIYDNKTSPYLKLLEMAGCEYGDFEKLVKSEGIEPSLKKLAGEGVYISIEEFKGKKDISRGGQVFRFKEREFDNPLLSGHFEARSGGSRSSGTRTIYDYDHLKANLTTYRIAMFDAYNALNTPFAIWAPIMPGGGPPLVLSITKTGKEPIRWFSPVEKRSFKPSFKNRMGTNFIVYTGRFFGAKLPAPEYVSMDDAWIVAEFIYQVIQQKGSCCLHSYPSLAIRICQTAREKGISLAGAIFFCGGEPITEAKRKEVNSVGAVICPIYVFMEGGFIGAGCLSPAASDDVHFFKDSFALVQHLREVPHAAASIPAFLFSTLLPSAPKILLNVESGDWGVITARKCGCKFENYGLTDHLYNIRGFDKLTGEGMTFIGTDLVRIIEEVLPGKFGGASTDYQMVEEEDETGHTHMNILVSPELGAIDDSDLINTVLSEISKGMDTKRMMAGVWAQAGTLRVKHLKPFTTARGKLMPLHIQQLKKTNEKLL
jgi:hypothetical protein